MKIRERVTYQETYRRFQLFVDDPSKLAEIGRLPPIKQDAQIQMIELRSLGSCTLNGAERKFFDLRVYVIPPPESEIDG